MLPCSLSHSEPAPPAQLAPAYDLLKPSAQASSATTSVATQVFGSCQEQVCVPFALHSSLQHFAHTPSVHSHALFPLAASHASVPMQLEPV